MPLLFLKVGWGMRYQWELGMYAEVVTSKSWMSIWAQDTQISREWDVPPHLASVWLKTAEMGNLFEVSEGTGIADKMVPAIEVIWIMCLDTNSTWEQGLTCRGGGWDLLKGKANLSIWQSNMIWKKEGNQEKRVNVLLSTWNILLFTILLSF